MALPWALEDRMPPAYPLCLNDQEELRYHHALAHPNRTFGLGTIENPLVVWLEWYPTDEREAVDNVSPSWIWSHNNFAKGMAKRLGLTCVWIVKPSHDKQYKKNEKGQKIEIGRHEDGRPIYEIEEHDMHMTLRFGTGLNACTLHCHVYVTVDEAGNPYKFTEDEFRNYKEGERHGNKFWTWVSSRKPLNPNFHLNFDPAASWQEYVDTGPYIDYSRPGPQRFPSPARSYHSPEVGKKERIERADTKEPVDVAKAQELTNLEKNLENLLCEIEISSVVSAEKKFFVYVLREQIATMKRDIFCEREHTACPFDTVENLPVESRPVEGQGEDDDEDDDEYDEGEEDEDSEDEDSEDEDDEDDEDE
ncbi:hypothetical protein GGS26DRAFT_603944 [Hypomontagnella submonticulosa]|nr:hypothetical protein GGS26DRAFT_603944 [Hypomontagnella submonticulosa]